MPSLEIKIEDVAASPNFIANLELAKEMTEQTKNNVLVQIATSLLAQGKGMNQVVLSLLG